MGEVLNLMPKIEMRGSEDKHEAEIERFRLILEKSLKVFNDEARNIKEGEVNLKFRNPESGNNWKIRNVIVSDLLNDMVVLADINEGRKRDRIVSYPFKYIVDIEFENK